MFDAKWADLFVDFLVIKHGLALALRSDHSSFDGFHAYFLDRLVPVCAQLLDAAERDGEISLGTGAYDAWNAHDVNASNGPRRPAFSATARTPARFRCRVIGSVGRTFSALRSASAGAVER